MEPEDYAPLGDVIITGCEFDSKRRVGVEINYSGLLNNQAGTILSVDCCRITQSSAGIIATGRDSGRIGRVDVLNCVIEDSTSNSLWIKNGTKMVAQ